MLEPKDIEINGKQFVIHKFDAVEGRRIICNYPTTALPKVGDYDANEEIMLRLMKYVSVRANDTTVALTSMALINARTGDWETLMKLEAAVLEYNCSFFRKGLVSTLLEDLAQKLPVWISKILMDSLGQLSQKEKQPSTN